MSLATGLGKSVVIATLPKLLSLRPGDVTVVVAHRDELIEQLVDKFRVENPEAVIGVEKAERRAPEECNIVVATVQTLAEKRLEDFVARFKRRISLFVIDEAHHAAAPSYRAIVDAVLAQRPEAMILGFTATPNRGDGVRLVDVFEKIVYTMDARKGIDAGYLVPVKSYAVATGVNLDEVASRGGDFVIGQLAQAVNIGQRNERIVAAYKQNTPGLKALVFTASVEHARDVAEEFVARGVNAEWASGETPREERERIVRDFRGTGIDVLVNCGLYLEGFDVPSVQVILNARPTKSTTLYTQITGRALRPLDDIASPLSNTNSALERRELIEKSPKTGRDRDRPRRPGAAPPARHRAVAVRAPAAHRRARPHDGAGRRQVRRAAAPRSQARREGAHAPKRSRRRWSRSTRSTGRARSSRRGRRSIRSTTGAWSCRPRAPRSTARAAPSRSSRASGTSGSPKRAASRRTRTRSASRTACSTSTRRACAGRSAASTSSATPRSTSRCTPPKISPSA